MPRNGQNYTTPLYRLHNIRLSQKLPLRFDLGSIPSAYLQLGIHLGIPYTRLKSTGLSDDLFFYRSLYFCDEDREIIKDFKSMFLNLCGARDFQVCRETF